MVNAVDEKPHHPDRPANVLLVDDDPIMCTLAQTRLVEAGYCVQTAHNGREAVASMAQSVPELIISDIDMPEMDGFELTRYVRSTPPFSDIPVIVITASDAADVAAVAFEAGATSFLDKPINWTLFSHAVKFVLRASRDQIAVREARDQAEAGARFKDSLMSVMSHELRTPLNAIIGFGQLLRDKFDIEDDALNREYADYIIDGGQRLLNSVSDMLLASDARSGPITISQTDATLGDLVELAAEYARKEIEVNKASLKIRLHDENCELRCDRKLVARALLKLIDNAIKFSQTGVEILVGSIRLRDGRLVLFVEDNGPGIDRESLRAIAAFFSQSDMSLTRSQEGLGLGLPLVKAIARSHGGSFFLEAKTPPHRSGTRAFMVFPKSRLAAPNLPLDMVANSAPEREQLKIRRTG